MALVSNSLNNYLKTIIDEGIKQARLAQLSTLLNLGMTVNEEIKRLRLAQLSALQHPATAIPATKVLRQVPSLLYLGLAIGDVDKKTLTAPLLPPKIAFDEASFKKLIKHKLSLTKCDYLVSTVDEIDFSEIVSFYSGLASDAELAEKLLPFLENKRLEIDKSINKLSKAQELILVAIFKRDQNNFVKWNSVDNNTIKASKSRSKTRLIKRGLITPNPAKRTKEVKLTRLGRYAARRILATQTVNFL